MGLADEKFPSSTVFDNISKGLKDKEFAAWAISELEAVFAIKLQNKTTESMTWIIDFKEEATVTRARGEEVTDVTLILSDENWTALVEGTSSAPKLYLLNKLKLVGPLSKAKKFNAVLTKLKEKGG